MVKKIGAHSVELLVHALNGDDEGNHDFITSSIVLMSDRFFHGDPGKGEHDENDPTKGQDHFTAEFH